MVDATETVKPYRWMKNGDLQRKLEIMAELRAMVESLPETAATLRPQSRRDFQCDDRYSYFVSDVLQHFGFWRMPDRHGGSNGNYTKYVNPEHPDTARFSDVTVECECGSLILHQNKRHMNHESFNDHTDDCKVEWKRAAQSELWANRREILTQNALNLIELPLCCTRLAVSERRAVHGISRRLDMDYSDIKEHGRQKRDATFKYLRDQGFTNRDIGEAFGVASNTVSGAVSRFENTDAVYAVGD